MPASIQGHHTFANQTATNLNETLELYLPGWNKDGVYNFQATASRNIAAEQLNLLKHSGSHDWIDKAIVGLVQSPYFDGLTADQKTKHLSALINYLYVSASPENVASGGAKTGGFIPYLSASDPRLIREFGRVPTKDEMIALTKSGMLNESDPNNLWSKILGSEAGQEVLALNPQTEVHDGKLVLVFNETVDNGDSSRDHIRTLYLVRVKAAGRFTLKRLMDCGGLLHPFNSRVRMSMKISLKHLAVAA